MANLIDILTKKQRKPRGFNYVPRYYKPDKEEFNQRVERLRQERDAADKGEHLRVNFKGAFSSKKVKKKSSYQKQMAMYNLRLIVILALVIFIGYHLSQSPKFSYYIDQFFNSLKNKNGSY